MVLTKLKEITKKEIETLIENDIIRNTTKGFVGHNGNEIGFYRTRHKRYLEDKYVDIARKLL